MEISSELIKSKCVKFKEDYSEVDDALKHLFTTMRKNTDMKEVLCKVVSINTLYSTNINGIANMVEIAKIICSNSRLVFFYKVGFCLDV